MSNQKPKAGILRKAKEFKKEIVYIRGYFIEMKDEHGQIIYTFTEKKKADEFFVEITKK